MEESKRPRAYKRKTGRSKERPVVLSESVKRDLEVDPQCNLNLARSGIRLGDYSSTGIGSAATPKNRFFGYAEIGPIEHIEKLGSKLEIPCLTKLGYGPLLVQRQIKGGDPGIDDRTSTKISIAPACIRWTAAG